MTAKVSLFVVIVLTLAASVAMETELHAQHPWVPHLSCSRVHNQGSLRPYDYRHDLTRFRDSALAIADPVRSEDWFEENLLDSRPESCAQHCIVAEVQPLIPQGKKASLVRPVVRKPFHFTRASLVANHVTLQQVGLSLYETGIIRATGRISYDGGPDGSLAGANVSLVLRAYAAPMAGDLSRQLPLNTPMFWESRHTLWVSRNQPQVVALTRSDQAYAGELRQNFSQITHLEVELVAERNR